MARPQAACPLSALALGKVEAEDEGVQSCAEASTGLLTEEAFGLLQHVVMALHRDSGRTLKTSQPAE
ncbi:hypothetical protein WMY93_012222 [Mugilogobius chulae]|uniref:Uncharacterized protein n=1 Tax=Mugilogobius chulae TaxID=88201 RepID=A0AAW0PAI5_9GOBI